MKAREHILRGWRKDRARCKALTASVEYVYFQAIEKRGKGEQPLLPRKGSEAVERITRIVPDSS